MVTFTKKVTKNGTRICVYHFFLVPLRPILICGNRHVNIGDIQTLFAQHPEIALAKKELTKGKDIHLLLSGLYASTRALTLSALKDTAPLFIILDNTESAQYLYADLKTILPDNSSAPEILWFPAAQKRRAVDEAAQIQRTETLTALSKGNGQFVITYPEAVSETVPAKETLTKNSFTLCVGQEIQLSQLNNQLSELNFTHVDFVFEPGQYAIRGGIVDIYSYSHDNPYRIDFFGDEIDSIREFDIEDQLSKAKIETAEIVAANSSEPTQASVLDYLPQKCIWVSNDFAVVKYKLPTLLGEEKWGEKLTTIELAEKSYFPAHSKITFDTTPQPVFRKQFDILTEDIRKHLDEGYKIYILADQKKQLDRLQAIFEAQTDDQIVFQPVQGILHEGFIDHSLKSVVIPTIKSSNVTIVSQWHRKAPEEEKRLSPFGKSTNSKSEIMWFIPIMVSLSLEDWSQRLSTDGNRR